MKREVKAFLEQSMIHLTMTMEDTELSEMDRVMYAKGIADTVLMFIRQCCQPEQEIKIIGGDKCKD